MIALQMHNDYPCRPRKAELAAQVKTIFLTGLVISLPMPLAAQAHDRLKCSTVLALQKSASGDPASGLMLAQIASRLDGAFVSYDKAATDAGLPPALVGTDMALSGEGLHRVTKECLAEPDLEVVAAIHEAVADKRQSLGLAVAPGDDIDLDEAGAATPPTPRVLHESGTPPAVGVKSSAPAPHSLMETLDRYQSDQQALDKAGSEPPSTSLR